jgi:hypothetical protein
MRVVLVFEGGSENCDGTDGQVERYISVNERSATILVIYAHNPHYLAESEENFKLFRLFIVSSVF